MARFNEINIGRWNRYAQKLTGMKGPPPAPQLASEIGLSHLIFSGVENRYLESWSRFGHHTAIGAVAGNGSGIEIRNPNGSNVIAVVEKLQLVNIGAATDVGFLSQGPGTTLAVPASGLVVTLDNRGSAHGALLLFAQNTVVGVVADLLSGVIGRVPLAVNTASDYFIDEMILTTLVPGDNLRWRAGAVNQAVAWNIIWRERFLEESERT